MKLLRKFTPKTLFLIDGAGALVSAFMLGVVLVRFESTFGMPRHVLYILSYAACGLALYSLTCHLWLKSNWKPFLKLISILNLSYCTITLGLVIYHHQTLTIIGFTYFILEMLIITILAIAEQKTARVSE